MRAIVVGALLAGVLVAASPTSGETLHFRAHLAPPGEAPPTEHRAAGLAELTLDTESKILSWRVTYSGLSGPLIRARFKAPPAPRLGEEGALDLPPPLVNPVVSSMQLSDAQIGDLRAGLWSLSLMTAKNPGGELKGDLERAP